MAYITIRVWRTIPVVGSEREDRVMKMILLALTLGLASGAYLSFHLPVPRHM